MNFFALQWTTFNFSCYNDYKTYNWHLSVNFRAIECMNCDCISNGLFIKNLTEFNSKFQCGPTNKFYFYVIFHLKWQYCNLFSKINVNCEWYSNFQIWTNLHSFCSDKWHAKFKIQQIYYSYYWKVQDQKTYNEEMNNVINFVTNFNLTASTMITVELMYLFLQHLDLMNSKKYYSEIILLALLLT